MIIDLYTICWNEEDMLPFFFQHYDSIVDRYVFFDDGSTDKTLEILAAHPKVEVRPLPRGNEDSYVLAAKNLHDTFWKESIGKADWAIYTAVDEFLYTKTDLRAYLLACKEEGITAIPALGYQMISEEFPEKGKNILSVVTSGAPWSNMSKLSIFNPNAISETNFAAGRHVANPQGNIVYPKIDTLLNLHCKYLNFEKTFQRHLELEGKLGSLDKKNNWGEHYSWSKDKLQSQWTFFKNLAHDHVLDTSYDSNLMHSPITERWWRAIKTEETPKPTGVIHKLKSFVKKLSQTTNQ